MTMNSEQLTTNNPIHTSYLIPYTSLNARLDALARHLGKIPKTRREFDSARSLAWYARRHIEIHCCKIYEAVPLNEAHGGGRYKRKPQQTHLLLAISDRDAEAKLVRFYKAGHICTHGNRLHLTWQGWEWLTQQAMERLAEHPNSTWAAQWMRMRGQRPPYDEFSAVQTSKTP